MKKILAIVIALVLLIPGVVYADSPLPDGVPPPPSIPLMIEGTAPEGDVTIEINDKVYEVYSDGKFYIPISGNAGDVITITQGKKVVKASYIDPMKTPFLSVSLFATEIIKTTNYDDDDDEVKVVSAFSPEDILWITEHGGRIY